MKNKHEYLSLYCIICKLLTLKKHPYCLNTLATRLTSGGWR